VKTVAAADANRNFSSLLREVQEGEVVTITSHGRPIAEISPKGSRHAANSRRRVSTRHESGDRDEHERAKRRLFEHLDRQSYLGLGRFERDWAHDD
jgi:prevent-host-death family protein